MRRTLGRFLPVGLILMLLLCGCWSRVEINDLAMVTEAGMDLAKNGKLSLVINVLITAAGRGGSMAGGEGKQRGPQVMTVSSEGRDVLDAMSKLQYKVPRRLFWGHIRTLVLGENLARSGVRRHLDFWLRHPEPRPTLQIVVARSPVEQFLSGQPSLRRFLAESVDEINRTGLGVTTSLRDFAVDLAGGARDPVAPFYEIVSDASVGGKESRELKMAGAVVFRGDRMVAVLEHNEHRGLVWLRGAPKEGTFTVEVPGRGLVSAKLLRASSRLSARQSRKAIVVTITAEGFVDIFESPANVDTSDPREFASLTRLLELALAERIRSTYALLTRELRVDPMGVGQMLRSSDPALWHRLKPQHHDLLPRTELVVTAIVHVERTGMQGIKTAPEEGDRNP